MMERLKLEFRCYSAVRIKKPKAPEFGSNVKTQNGSLGPAPQSPVGDRCLLPARAAARKPSAPETLNPKPRTESWPASASGSGNPKALKLKPDTLKPQSRVDRRAGLPVWAAVERINFNFKILVEI